MAATFRAEGCRLLRGLPGRVVMNHSVISGHQYARHCVKSDKYLRFNYLRLCQERTVGFRVPVWNTRRQFCVGGSVSEDDGLFLFALWLLGLTALMLYGMRIAL